jgi:hypothetical protein
MNKHDSILGTQPRIPPKTARRRAASVPRSATRELDFGAPGADEAELFATAPLSGRRTSIAVVRAHGAWHIVALQPFAAGERILAIEGELTAQPTQYSVQVDDAAHVEIPSGELGDLERIFDRYPWRFLNHSCAPSARVEGRALLAARALAPWEEITFDYNTTEEAMASPFACRCGHCDGRRIGGFSNLTRAEQERLRPNLAPHLRRRLDSPAR